MPNPQITVSDRLIDWLSQENISLAFTTYQTNRLFFIGNDGNGKLKINERLFDKPMGLFAQKNRLYMSSRYQLWHFDNCLNTGEKYAGCDRLYVPRTTYTTGDLNVHDVAIDNRGRIIFVNTDFSCLATLDPQYSFIPVWQPKFIDRLVSEDRCHLNGLAMKDGEAAYVTACSATNQAASWRNHRRDGGVVVDIKQNEIVATGLSMPHSPRWYQGKLWMLNSGTGEFGYIDDNNFTPITFCPGFVRGLAFWKNLAIVGMSKLRCSNFTGLVLEERLKIEENSPHCGLMIINLTSGKIVHWFHIGQIIEELFDVVVLEDTRQPQALGLHADKIQRLVTFPNSGGIVTTKPSLKPTNTEQIPLTPESAQNIKYQRVYHINPGNANTYNNLVYPRLQQLWQINPPQGEILGVSASIDSYMIGLIFAELSQSETATVSSFMVLKEYRCQGVGRKLLYYLEQELAKHNYRNLTLSYNSSDETELALKKLLQNLGWKPFQLQSWQCRATKDKIAQAPWIYRYLLPESLVVFPWNELTNQDRDSIKQLDYPQELSPFNNESTQEPMNSLGLRYGDRIIGWIITHRIDPQTIHYKTLYIASPWNRPGKGIALLAEAIYRQMNSKVINLVTSIPTNHYWSEKFVNRYLKPYLTDMDEWQYASKNLRPITSVRQKDS